MHPISKLNFGSDAGKIAVEFYNGSSAVSGYIVKQTGTKRFVVTADGTHEFTCSLVGHTPAAAGEMNILVNAIVNGDVSGTSEHVISISTNKVVTAEGNQYIWTYENTATEAGYAQISTISAG